MTKPDPVHPLPTAVIAAMRRVMRPLVRLMIRHGITLPSMIELLKQVLVDVVDRDLPVQGKRTTDSRISVLTGVHRKDVRRLREGSNKTSDIPKKMSIGTQVVNTWLTDPVWQDASGAPLVLPRSSENPLLLSFERLAESVSNDVRPRAILDELLRSGVVGIDDDGKVKLLAHGYIPTEAEEEKLYYFEKAAYAHLLAGVSNLEEVKPRYFDRVVQYRRIPADAVPKLRALLDDEGMSLLKKINAQTKRSKREESNDDQSFVVGLYFYHEPADKD